MSALTWSALSFFLLVLVAGTIWLAVVGLAGWRTFRALQRGVLAQLSVLAGRGAALEARAAALGERGIELQESIARLNRSLARARVLLLAVHDVRSAMAGLRAFVPKK